MNDGSGEFDLAATTRYDPHLGMDPPGGQFKPAE